MFDENEIAFLVPLAAGEFAAGFGNNAYIFMMTGALDGGCL